jgi:membrane protease YdiL (CAAX protease family)
MKTNKINSTDQSISFYSIIPYLLITFGVTWGIIALYIFLPDQTVSLFGEITGNHPLFFLATYSPAIAALGIILMKVRWSGTKRFLGRMLLWRAPAPWYLFILLGVPAMFYLGAIYKGLSLSELFPVSSLGVYLVSLLLFAIKGPVEEIGWRGFALPMLQRKMSPFFAAIIVGIVWGFWHLPAFFLSGVPQGAWSFMPFFVGTIALSIFATGLFNASRGSILLPALLHLQLINPLWPDAQPYDTVFVVIAAAIILWLNRSTMFRKSEGVTTIIPDSDAEQFHLQKTDYQSVNPMFSHAEKELKK